MEAEPWEALDLDDSDLPSLLRACKRRRSPSPTTTAAANPLPQSPATHEQLQQQPPPSTSRHRSIPGPAGAVQAAILRKNLDCQSQNFSNNREGSGEDLNGTSNHSNGVISTQDYIRRAMEDTAEFDDDFAGRPWLSALEFLGAEAGVVRSTPISSIKKCLNAGKVVQVVAVVKSCTQNGHGGLMVLLKDPTGTVGASIHHKVLSESEFGKNISMGSVLILREVAVFAPVRSAHYLNITLRNLVKVFNQDSCSTSKLQDSAYPVQYADPGIEHCGKAKTMEMSTMQNVTMEDIEETQRTREAQNLQTFSVIQRQNLFSGSVQSRVTISESAAWREHKSLSQDACEEVPQQMTGTRITADHVEFVNSSETSRKNGNSEGSLLNDTNNITNPVGKGDCEEIQRTDEVQMQRQPPISKTSLPQWTDEQLDELFAGDEDDGSLF
ncbi:hypothetical protein Salat_2831900 [Sesamum alatum]|uniref:Homologous recombination OB-fold protein OB-fold domain-containing protein n=1 Tax=Sesamum alatum TaxID=300844 RepID=A0AAE1XLG3_9LAMI|nr:hypothetical protein Salat_2831900 [Sesamum alatum]